ncbi:hypothetical protein D5S18_14075 [Nocardia panacis]|uniref:Uncharacterized protein n=2 Tax=Nocardia panacis TaxID=2340916 RepID=A0A3A4K8T1_9NOCA|nr:hypothetical protein [Nocardia panacis]RJO75644.1 hypothetical protein D5S18_14075 [Nocardia panacis]
MPGQQLSSRPEPADPVRIRTEIDGLLAELRAGGAESGIDLARRAHILEQAHEVLVQALATVDKI